MNRFVAVGLPAALRVRVDGRLAPVRERFPDVAWTRPEGWHLTLAFCGGVDPEHVPGIVAAVRAARHADADRWREGIELRLGRVALLGRSAIAVRVEQDGRLVELSERIQAELGEAGMPVTRRRVDAHVTLARMRRSGPGARVLLAELAQVLGSPDSRDWSWTATRVGAWRSEPGAGPARYVEESVVALDPSGD